MYHYSTYRFEKQIVCCLSNVISLSEVVSFSFDHGVSSSRSTVVYADFHVNGMSCLKIVSGQKQLCKIVRGISYEGRVVKNAESHPPSGLASGMGDNQPI